ncbi:hypothetical protein N7523_002458 [Penicillium sp. IBT 18751x]|nr:hypothetical protein N7523_002458 [Penicillium sp. IBT 18751x]
MEQASLYDFGVTGSRDPIPPNRLARRLAMLRLALTDHVSAPRMACQEWPMTNLDVGKVGGAWSPPPTDRKTQTMIYDHEV